MNHVERFRAALDFQPVDRLPQIEWATWWDKTIARWHGEGLPPTLTDPFEIGQYLGLDPLWQAWFGLWTEATPRPGGRGLGIVADMDDYRRVAPTLFPAPDTAVKVLIPWAAAQRSGQRVVWITLEGFFWFPRGLMNVEPHLLAFYDQPELMHRMNQDLADYYVRLLARLAKVCRPTFMTFAEDMSYNHGPMLSRKLFEEFLAPYYRQVVPLLKEMGTTVLVDTDGDVTALAPWLLDVGVEGILPLERQAGVDGLALRRSHPRLRIIGHFDKMVMARGERAMRDEFERLMPLMKSGGFIPSVDHQTPPDVSLDQYRCYLGLLREYTEWAAR